MKSTVFVVHCIDTEGPLHESLEATFERLERIFQLKLEPDKYLLEKLQKGEVDLNGLEKSVQRVLDPHLLNYNDTWDKIDTMLSGACSSQFRNSFPDSEGNGWIYNWFCVDHVNYEMNPRRRDIGYHNVFDHYRGFLEKNNYPDGLHFHFHPQPIVKHAHLDATHWWASSDTLHQVLARRIIDRNWFPAANRPGFHVTRPDSHWFLEQYIPFDLANQAMDADELDLGQPDYVKGRWGDWRRSVKSWTPYHPYHDDYQRPGSCRRWIARCLNVGTRYLLLGEKDVRQAFEEARDGKPVVMAFTDHDFRDIRRDVDYVRKLIKKVKPSYPGVDVEFCEAVTAMRKALSLPASPKCNLELSLKAVGDGAHVLTVSSDEPVFGPQPFLAVKTVTKSYYHDDLDFQIPKHRWTYVFDEATLPLKAVEKIGVAANNAYGITSVAVLDVATGTVHRSYFNE